MKLFLPFLAFVSSVCLLGCDDGQDPILHSKVRLGFENVYQGQTILLSQATPSGAAHGFKEIKYVISNIRMVGPDGTEYPYHTDNLDKGAMVIDHAKPHANSMEMSLPLRAVAGIRFGVGVLASLNELDEERFPLFYQRAGKNDTQLHWEWADGYRFAKIEGFYGAASKPFSVHTGSVLFGKKNAPSSWKLGIDAYREVTLSLPSTQQIIPGQALELLATAHWERFFEGLQFEEEDEEVTIPSVHNARNMTPYLDNMGKIFSLRVK